MSGCSSAGRAGRLVTGSNPSSGQGWSVLERDTEPSTAHQCSSVRALRWAGDDLSREHPALALRRGWDWLQQQHPATPWKGTMTWHDIYNVTITHCNYKVTPAGSSVHLRTESLTGEVTDRLWSLTAGCWGQRSHVQVRHFNSIWPSGKLTWGLMTAQEAVCVPACVCGCVIKQSSRVQWRNKSWL